MGSDENTSARVRGNSMWMTALERKQLQEGHVDEGRCFGPRVSVRGWMEAEAGRKRIQERLGPAWLRERSPTLAGWDLSLSDLEGRWQFGFRQIGFVMAHGVEAQAKVVRSQLQKGMGIGRGPMESRWVQDGRGDSSIEPNRGRAEAPPFSPEDQGAPGGELQGDRESQDQRPSRT